MTAERRRLSFALLLSVVMHALLLSLTFGGQGPGLPGFGFPWRERRIEAPNLHIVLVPARVAAPAPARRSDMTALPQASIGQPLAAGPALTPFVPLAPALRPAAETVAPEAKPTAEAKPEPDAAAGAAPATATLHPEGSDDAAPAPTPDKAGIAMERSDEADLVVPATRRAPPPVMAAASSASSPVTAMLAPRDAGDAARERAIELAELDRSQQEAQRQAVQAEAARIENARLEAERQEAARQAQARQEATRREAEQAENARLAAARQEAARREAERVENARLDAERQEAARQAAARQEAARQEVARRDAERVETARLETERQEAAREAAARQEATRLEAVRQETARLEAAQAADARREAARRAMGRQLDEEAARRDAASTAASQPSRPAPSSSGARRGRLFGRTDPNAELILYAEAWARKIQLNMTFDMVRDAAKRPHTDPLVTVAIRSDGSVESVTFVTSSGVAAIDEAIRRIVQSQVPYPAFPPALAREFDVVEIRRTWHFDMAIRLY